MSGQAGERQSPSPGEELPFANVVWPGARQARVLDRAQSRRSFALLVRW